MRNLIIRSKHIFWTWLSFLIFVLPAVILYPSPKGLREYSYLIGSSILCYVTYKIVQSPQYRRYVKPIFYLIILLSVIAAVKGIYEYGCLGIDRPDGPFRQPNLLAAHMEIIIPIVIAALLSKQNVYFKAILSVVLLLLFGGLIVTLSRGAWLAAMVSVVLMLVSEKKYIALLLACIPAAAAVVVRYDSVLARLQSIFDLQMHSNIERLHGYYSSLLIIKTYPLTGIGLENFKTMYPQYMLPNAKEVLTHAHNLILVYATEAGILAALAFAISIIITGVYFSTHFKKITNQRHRLLVLGIAYGVLALLLHGLVDYTLRHVSILVVFMFLVGLGLGIVRYYEILADKQTPEECIQREGSNH